MNAENINRGKEVYNWWNEYIEPRDKDSRARALSARLRRGSAQSALCEPEVHELARRLYPERIKWDEPHVEMLARLVRLLAELRHHDGVPLARRLGGAEPILSKSRFERLIRAEGEESTDLLRRAIVMGERRCNVRRLAQDLLHWDNPSHKARNTWCFEYFHADTPQSDSHAH